MKTRSRPPLWVRSFRAIGSRVLAVYPRHVREALGEEILDAMGDRLAERRRAAGWASAMTLGLRELLGLARAADEARRELAHAVRLGRAGRRARSLRPAGALGRDGRQALRAMFRAPGPTALVVLLIGIGIGASTSVFSVVDGVLLDPLPFDEPDELVQVWADRSWLEESRGLLADVQVQDLQRQAESLEALSALWMVSGRVLGGKNPVHTDVARVSANFFEILGVRPHIGRTFVQGEDLPGADWVAILEHDYWVREFGSDPDVIGSFVRIGWYDMEVVGVLPPHFTFPIPDELGAHGEPDIWLPWRHTGAAEGRLGGGTLAVVGRLAEGVGPEAAQEELDGLARSEDTEFYDNRGFGYRLESVRDAWVGDVRPSLLTLSGAAVLVMLIAIANAGVLVLARTRRRRRELALRRALGASQARIMRLLTIEGFLLAAAGCVVGIALAASAMHALLAVAPAGIPRLDAVRMDGGVLGFSVLASFVAGLVATWIPLAPLLSRAGSGYADGAGALAGESRRVQGGLVVAQVALSVVLVAGAGLFIRTFQQLQSTDLGFEGKDRLTFSVYLMNDYPELAAQVDFYRRLRESIFDLPGVRSVSATSSLPLTANPLHVPVSLARLTPDVDPNRFFLTEGFSVLGATELDATSGEGWVLAALSAAHPHYFRTTGIDVLAGRGIIEADRSGSLFRIVLDRTLAERFWSVEAAVGERVWVAGAWREIVGVVEHVRARDPRSARRPQAYLPYTQVRSGRVSMVVHAEADPLALVPHIRAKLAAIDPLVPIADIRLLDTLVRRASARERFGTVLMSAFALTAIILAGAGVYGLQSLAVGDRAREIAVRMTVGSGRLRVAGMVFGAALKLTVLGLAIGLAAAWLLGPTASAALYDVSPRDPATLATTSVLMILVSMAASLKPTTRAISVDPAETLRAD